MEQPMLPRIISPMLNVSPRKLVPIFFILGGLVSSCTTAPQSSPDISTVEPTQTAVADVSTPAPQAPEITPAQTSVSDAAQSFSSDQLGLCFSFPQGYEQMPYNDTVEIVAPSLGPNTELRGLFWLEMSDAQNRTAEEVANQEVKDVAGLNPGRWTVTLGGEEALVLDGMPGQDLVRRVYIVHQQTLYILTFSPTRSENTAASDQMEALYTAVTSSWAWSPCPASK
jgi:hypothetical protein